MVNLQEELFNTLQELKRKEFKNFKWFLKQDDILKGFKGIPVAQLEKADRQDTVDLMVQKYQDPGALLVTMKVLEKIHRNDLVKLSQNFHSGPKDLKTQFFGAQKEEDTRERPKLKWVQKFAVEVTLDPDTAHPGLILSDDRKQVHCSDVYQNLPDNPKRFNKCVNILGEQHFSSGRFYYEVQVKGKIAWDLGVAKESISRKGQITLCPDNGYWTIWLRNMVEYMPNDDDPVCLPLKKHPLKVGVFVNYEEGLVCFYDVDAADLLYTFTDCSFSEKLYPYLSPCTNKDGTNSTPLIISPVSHPLNLKTCDFEQKEQYERKKADLRSIQQFPVGPDNHKTPGTDEVTVPVQDQEKKEVREYPVEQTGKEGTDERRKNLQSIQSLPGDEERLFSVRKKFIKSVTDSVLKDLLDELLQRRVINSGEMETMQVTTIRADKARGLIDTVLKKGNKACKILIDNLCNLDPHVSKKLGLKP